jgi:uncharacterized protein
MNISPVDLLILQPSALCNLNCSYCYLPDRKNARVMPVEVVRATIEKLRAEELLPPEFSIIWHAGEPTVVKREVYAEYFKVIQTLLGPEHRVAHHFQTNGLLLNDAWCEFIREHEIIVGVSIDGPPEIHDAYRKSWNGRGTCQQTLRGIENLHSHEIDFHTISVITNRALGRAGEIYEFLRGLKPTMICFNTEEQEGVNCESIAEENDQQVEEFFREIYRRSLVDNFDPPIREFEQAFMSIGACAGRAENCQVTPFEIFSVAVDGSFTTFSPELLGMSASRYGSFSLGNILCDSPRRILETDKFRRMFNDINEGVANCEASCEYYALCGGGTPSNKVFENGTFTSTTTRFCEQSVKLPRRIVIENLEAAISAAA